MDDHDRDVKRMDPNEPVLFRLRDFYVKFHRQIIILAILLQIFTIGILLALFVTLITKQPTWEIMLIIAGVATVIELVGGFLLIGFTMRPLKIVSRLIDHKLDDNTEPLNLNEAVFHDFGMSPFTDSVKHALAGSTTRATVKAQLNSGIFDKTSLNFLNRLPIGLIALNANGVVVFANALAPLVQGEIELDFTGFEETLSSFLIAAKQNAISRQKSWLRVQNHPRKNDEADSDRRIYDVIASYDRDAPGDAETVIVTIDQTDSYRDDETGMDFVALAAHELRSPITLIRGYLEILGDQLPHLTDQQQKIMDSLNVSAHRLSSYVSNVLNVSHFDHRHLQLELKEVSVDTIISDIRSDMELRARTVGRKLIFNIPHDLPTVAADRSSISEVVSNLIDNAVKYSHDGGLVEVSAKTAGDFVDIAVADQGIGIPGNVAEHLFDKFYRSHKSSSVVGGTGLGLYISRAIVESHGGHISVESVEDKGSIFTFSLPIFASVADKIASGNNVELIRDNEPRINNHGFTES